MKKRTFAVCLLGTLVLSFFGPPPCASPQILTEEVSRDISGQVIVIEGDFLSLLYDQPNGVDNEMVFTRNDSIRYVNRRSWGEIRVGDSVKISYTESLRTRTARDATGLTLSHQDIVARTITVMTFSEALQTPLASGAANE